MVLSDEWGEVIKYMLSLLKTCLNQTRLQWVLTGGLDWPSISSELPLATDTLASMPKDKVEYQEGTDKMKHQRRNPWAVII